MKPAREEFEQLVVAALEAPDDATLIAQRDAALAQHPEWRELQREIETLWHTARMTKPAALEPDFDAPRLPLTWEARLMRKHEHRMAAPENQRKLRPFPRWQITLAAVAAVALLIGVLTYKPATPAWGLTRAGEPVTANSPLALISHDGTGWSAKGDWAELNPALRATLTALLNQNHVNTAKPVLRNSGADALEIWSPRGTRREAGSPILIASTADTSAEVQLRAYGTTKLLWRSQATALNHGPAALPLPDDLSAGAYELTVTPTGRPLGEKRVTFIVAKPVAPSGPVTVVQSALSQLLQPEPAVGDAITGLIHSVQSGSPEAMAARELLGAIGTGYDLPQLRAWAEQRD